MMLYMKGGISNLPPYVKPFVGLFFALFVGGEVTEAAIAADDDIGLCHTYYALETPVDLSSCSTEFRTCYDEGYQDDYLCEGCSLVSVHDVAVTDGSIDSDCACTCCFSQYVFNFCYRNYCDNEEEYGRVRSYLSDICTAAPVRTFMKPISDPEDPGMPLFVSNGDTVYRSLETGEKNDLFDYIGQALDFSSIAGPSLEKRSFTSDCVEAESKLSEGFIDAQSLEVLDEDEETSEDYENDEDVLEEHEDKYNDVDIDAEDYNDSYGGYPDDFDDGADDDGDIYPPEFEDDVEENVGDFDTLSVAAFNSLHENDSPVLDPAGYESFGREYSQEVDHPGPVVEDAEDPYDDMNDWPSSLNPEDFEDVDDPSVLEDLEPIDPAHPEIDAPGYVPKDEHFIHSPEIVEDLYKRDVDVAAFHDLYTGGVSEAFGDISDLSVGQLIDVMDAMRGNAKAFLSGLKLFLSEDLYDAFYDAFYGALDKVLPSSIDHTHTSSDHPSCSQSLPTEFYDTPIFFTSQDNSVSFTLTGCLMAGYYSSRSSGGSGHWDCDDMCKTFSLMAQCYSPDKTWPPYVKAVSLLKESCGSENDPLISSSGLLDSEEKLSTDLAFLRHIEPVAASLNILNELAEVQAEYLWKASSDSNPDYPGISAAVVIDKCEMEKKDLDDYLQFNLDSCDIRDLFYCKNHYKKNKCLPDLTNTTNPCNNACCLETKMAQCAKSHCLSKKAVNEFKVIANLVCSKYADANYTNGVLPYPEAVTSVSTTSTSTSADCTETDSYTETEDATATETNCDPTSTVEFPDEVETDEASDDSILTRRLNSDTDLILAQFGGDNYDDYKARVGESFCKLEEFSPGYDTTTCDRREVKDCIKEGIQTLKDDPEHFCPYCVNNNAYDECRCACCFGRYFSRVCYDPNCKDLSEKLRYKRYVKDVCKTKPITKYLFARVFEEDPLELQEKQRFKEPNRKAKNTESVKVPEIDIFAGFDDIHPEVETKLFQEPVNANVEILEAMKKSSLRRPLKTNGRVHQRDVTNFGNEEDFDDASESRDAASRDGLSEKLHKQLGSTAKKFIKGGSTVSGSAPKKERFSINDRKTKVTGGRVSAEETQEYNGTLRRKKHLRKVMNSNLLKKKKKSGRKVSLSGEKFGAGTQKQPKIRILNNNGDPKKPVKKFSAPVARRLRARHGEQVFIESPKRTTKIPSYSREVLYKRGKDAPKYVKGPEVPEAVIHKQSEIVDIHEGHIEEEVQVMDVKHYKTLTRTVHKTKQAQNLTLQAIQTDSASITTSSSLSSSSTSDSLSTSSSSTYAVSTTTVVSTSVVTTSTTLPASTTTEVSTVIYSSAVSTTTAVTTSVITTSTTLPGSTTTEVSVSTIVSSSTLPASMTTVVTTESVSPSPTCAVNFTTTSIKTRFRPSTTTLTQYQSVSTLVTTEFESVTTEVWAKKTVYRYKNTLYETETVPTTVVEISTVEKIVPNITITEIEESDQTVTSLTTTTTTTSEVEFETAYRDTTVSTLTTYSGTLTSFRYKFTVTKYKKWGEVTETTTEYITDDVIITKWYPETTVTEYDETYTKVKYKWYPYTTTDYEVYTTTTTAPTTTTTTATTTATATATATAAARPVPSVSLPNVIDILTSLLVRREDSDVQAYQESQREHDLVKRSLVEISQLTEDERLALEIYDDDVEYVIVEEVVEVSMPDEDDTSVKKLDEKKGVEPDRSSNQSPHSTEKNYTFHNTGNPMFESSARVVGLDPSLVKGCSLVVVAFSLIFMCTSDPEDVNDRVAHRAVHSAEGDNESAGDVEDPAASGELVAVN